MLGMKITFIVLCVSELKGMDIKMKKMLVILSVMMTMLMCILNGCSNDTYYSSKDSNKIPDESYSKFDDDISEIFSWEDDGKIAGEYNFQRGVQSGTDSILEGHGVIIWGTSTLVEFEAKEKINIELTREEKNKSGLCKLVVCDKEGIVENVEENETKKIVLEEGEYSVKIIGEPAEFSYLCVKLKGVEQSEMK